MRCRIRAHRGQAKGEATGIAEFSQIRDQYTPIMVAWIVITGLLSLLNSFAAWQWHRRPRLARQVATWTAIGGGGIAFPIGAFLGYLLLVSLEREEDRGRWAVAT